MMKPPPEDQPPEAGKQGPVTEQSGRTVPDVPPVADLTLPTSNPATAGEGGGYPRRFGKFNLLRLIAAGGMGEVYEAEELAPSPTNPERLVCVRRVALKRILPRYLEASSAVERFRRETQAGKALDHPNIVPVYESGMVEGEHYFTMPFVTGGDLGRHINDDPLTPRQAARVVQQMAQAIGYAHQAAERPIIHRDIKPQNIVLQPSAIQDVQLDDSQLSFIPRLTDFGLARVVTEESSLSMAQKGEAMGTPGYMPPEQALGDIDRVGPASDIYSIGAVLYALLVGRPPFPLPSQSGAGQTVPVLATLNQVVNLEPAPLRTFRPDVPRELEDICLKCLRKAPEDRYASALQLAEALDDFLAGRPEVRHTPRAEGWLAQLIRRTLHSVWKYPLRSAYLVLTTAGVILLVVLLLYRSGTTDQEALRREAEGHLEVARTRTEPMAAAERVQLACAAYDKLIGTAAPTWASQGDWLARARTHLLRARYLMQSPRYSERAAATALLARDQLHRLGHACPGDEEQQAALADAYQTLAEAVAIQDTPTAHEEAVRYYREALKVRRGLVQRRPGDPAQLQALARCQGYLGDSYLELGQMEQALAAYTEARQTRRAVVEVLAVTPGESLVEAHCMHARDYYNFARLYEWETGPDATGKVLAQRRERVKYYQQHLADVKPLPGEFRSERANSEVALASALLDHVAGAEEVGAVLESLDRAVAEYRELLGTDSTAYDVRLGLTNADVARAEALLRRGQRAKAREHLESALRFYMDDEAPQALQSNLYGRAVVLAWLEGINGTGREGQRALEYLGRAINKGFHHRPRLLRERAFQSLRESPSLKEEFAELERKVQPRFKVPES